MRDAQLTASRQSPEPATRNPRLNVMMMTDVTGRGGAEKALVDLALHLDRDRFNVTVCATRSAGNYQPLLDAGNIPTFVLGRRTRWEMDKLAGLVRLLRRERVHILHTHLFGSNTWGRLLGRLAGAPVIISHEHWSSKPKREIWLDRCLYRLSDRILVTSQASKRVVMSMERIPSRYISVVYNGVDTREFAPGDEEERQSGRKALNLPADALVIGMLGRLTPDKGGQDDLLRAFAWLTKSQRPVGKEPTLLVVGDGPLRAQLEQLCVELGIKERTVFAGQRSGSEIARLLRVMDVFVQPSMREAFPIALIEAMAVGLPVVATKVGGVPEVVEDGVNGLLAAPGEPTQLQESLQRFVSDPEFAQLLGAKGRAHVQAHFTLAHMTDRVEQIYTELAIRKLGARFGFDS